ncbi:MAG: hypothetical protein HC840_30595, partial [Leptolyngbyaceae cyanobacterium RM2_2_4]|nr:hypothetical protein [Leptolyngbyaceae cyanobacterium RM2_2_4]
MGEAPAAVVVADNATSAMITFNVPAGAVIGTNVGARFRLTTDDLSLLPVASEGAAGDGEVEDYLVRVEAAVNPITLCPQGVEGVEVFTLDFDTDDAGNTLIAGTSNINTNQPYANIFGGGMGITFASDDPSNNPLNLYNSEGSGGADPDLERGSAWAGGNLTTENLGNLLIINENATISTPNDNDDGGKILSISTMSLSDFAFDLVDVEDSELDDDDFITFENTLTGESVDVLFTDFEPTSGSPFAVAGLAYGDRFANRITGITATKLGISSFNKITFETDASFGIGAICIKKAVQALGSIGNYVWLDEDSNGLQDEGEAGIPNVQVDLKDMNGMVIATTFTDSDGKYLFPNLPAAMYFVDVVESTLPTGVTQTTVFTNVVDGSDADTDTDDGDLGNKDQSQNGGYKITLDSGEENLTADFGYNYNPTGDVDNPTGSPVATLGDRVWIDSDGDGVQDPNEIGVSGVEVTLMGAGADGIFGNGDDVTATTTTDENGNYIFDGLTPGAYMVTLTDDAGASHDVLNTGNYDQTGDPDHFAANESTAPAGTANDNKATRPVILGPGDVFLNVDFGYQPEAGTMLGSIGNTIWLDADADQNGPSAVNSDAFNGLGGQDDANEQPIAGVSVALIKDLNGNGTWEAGEPIIATDVTDANGQYLFEDLPITDGAGSDDYIVWVTDTDNVLDGLKPTYDADGGAVPTGSGAPVGGATSATLGISAVSNLTATPVTDQDFGYTPEAQDAGEGLIGDKVFFDDDNDGMQSGDEPGIEGVIVELYKDLNNDGDIEGAELASPFATTLTDENGNYYFGGLALNMNYQVVIPAPGVDNPVLTGLENVFDPNGGNDNQGGIVTLTPSNPVDLMQDFGYSGDDANTLGSIGNLVWEDLDADGIKDANEVGIAGVTLDLYRDLNGDGQINPGEP